MNVNSVAARALVSFQTRGLDGCPQELSSYKSGHAGSAEGYSRELVDQIVLDGGDGKDLDPTSNRTLQVESTPHESITNVVSFEGNPGEGSMLSTRVYASRDSETPLVRSEAVRFSGNKVQVLSTNSTSPDQFELFEYSKGQDGFRASRVKSSDLGWLLS